MKLSSRTHVCRHERSLQGGCDEKTHVTRAGHSLGKYVCYAAECCADVLAGTRASAVKQRRKRLLSPLPPPPLLRLPSALLSRLPPALLPRLLSPVLSRLLSALLPRLLSTIPPGLLLPGLLP